MRIVGCFTTFPPVPIHRANGQRGISDTHVIAWRKIPGGSADQEFNDIQSALSRDMM